MPKIIINEYDNTQPGVSSYENFTVLIPGLVAAGKPAENFDEYGVCELKSVEDFETKIGKVPVNLTDSGIVTTPAVGPENILKITGTLQQRSHKYYTAHEQDPVLNVYTRTEITELSEQKIGKLVSYESDEKWYRYSPEGGIDTSVVAFDKDTDYFTIPKGDEGANETEGNPNSHYGNQMAYLLLKLGYRVLYKKIKFVGEETEKTIPEILGSDNFWKGLNDKSLYDFRYIVTGLLNNNADANEQIAALATFKNQTNVPPAAIEATGRGDCIALLDVPASEYTKDSAPMTQAEAIASIRDYVSGSLAADKFSAFFAPFVIYGNMPMPESDPYQNNTFPASFHYLACAINAFDNLNFKEWFAVAGFTRGVAASEVTETGCRFGENATNILQPRAIVEGGTTKAVNLIIKSKTGYYIWGNRTAHKLGDELVASDFLNIRQLCTTLKKQIYVACHKFTFDPNSDILWINFVDAIEPTLRDMKANQGISDYKFIKVKTSQKGVLRAKIRIVPIEAVEDFHISLFLEENVSGTTVEIEDAD